MKCEELQFNLPLYAEVEIGAEESALVNEHLNHCPLCRAKLRDFKTIQRDLRNFPRVSPPLDLVYSVRNAVAGELGTDRPRGWRHISEVIGNILEIRLMPYAIGTAISVFIMAAFVLSLSLDPDATTKVLQTARVNTKRDSVDVLIKSPVSDGIISNEELAALRQPVSHDSPSLNTRGALFQLTKSMANGKIKSDELTFVADVFSDGFAQLAEIVDSPQKGKTFEEISNALQNNENYSPFVSAEMDKRSDVVRIVFRIQRVNVFDKSPKKKNLRSKK